MNSARPTPAFQLANETIAARVLAGLNKIGLAMRSQAQDRAGRRGLSPTQGQILALLRYRGRGPDQAAEAGARSGMTVGEIAAALAVTAATVSDSVRALEGKGLVARRAAREDARVVCVSLTATGRRAAEDAASWSDFMLEAIDALSPEERAVFHRALIKMIRSLQERGLVSVSRMCVTCRYFRPHAHGDDAARPHHCDYVNAPMGDGDLRVECPEHETAPEDQAARIYRLFVLDAATAGKSKTST